MLITMFAMRLEITSNPRIGGAPSGTSACNWKPRRKEAPERHLKTVLDNILRCNIADRRRRRPGTELLDTAESNRKYGVFSSSDTVLFSISYWSFVHLQVMNSIVLEVSTNAISLDISGSLVAFVSFVATYSTKMIYWRGLVYANRLAQSNKLRSSSRHMRNYSTKEMLHLKICMSRGGRCLASINSY